MALQLHRVPGSTQHPGHYSIRPFAKQFDFAPEPADTLRQENSNVEGFALGGHCGAGAWPVPHSGYDPRGGVRNRSTAPGAKRLNAGDDADSAGYTIFSTGGNLAVRFRANELLNRPSLGGCQFILHRGFFMPENLDSFN
jgi:hypothetical protein